MRGGMLLDDVKRAFAGRTVLVTGHSGFKGGWLTLWLASLGARVVGASLPPDQGPDNLFDKAAIAGVCQSSRWIDIRDADAVGRLFAETKPEIVFHLAAQALVRRAYRDTIGTFATNVMGTAHVLEAARSTESVSTIVCVTSDKVYDNREWVWPFREIDPLGGQDPYSASKSASEMLARSYMTALRARPDGYLLATARGGNVVGGGDWSEDRIVPDLVRAIVRNDSLVLRNPSATRPWQHVLELCLGYLALATRLQDGRPERDRPRETFVGAYNFGPDPSNETQVGVLVREILSHWGKRDHPIEFEESNLHESTCLRLDSSKARADLGWAPLLSFPETSAWTASWYRAYLERASSARALMEAQIDSYSRSVAQSASRKTGEAGS